MAEGELKRNVVFIGWSGEKAKAAAEALRDFLRKVIQSSDPWVSSQDIPSGSVWDSELHRTLESAVYGISCVTAENVTKPWVNYEAGAMAQKLRGCYCPYLIDAPKNALAPTPLTRLQAREANKDETKQLVQDVCKVLSSEFGRVAPTFDLLWPDFETALNNIRASSAQQTKQRTDREVLDEVLNLAQRTNKLATELANRHGSLGRRIANTRIDDSARRDDLAREIVEELGPHGSVAAFAKLLTKLDARKKGTAGWSPDGDDAG